MTDTTKGARLVAPNGVEIRGTLERLSGVALASVYRNANGTFEVCHEGGTDIWWDEQRTVVRNGQVVFIDEEGGEWLESQLVPAADEESDGEGEG